MAETEEDIKRIENMIAVLESNLLKADPRERDALKNTVSDLRARREEIQKKIKEREEQEMVQQRYNLEVSQAMQRETGLNSEEKGVFGNFLQKEFFTKADFGALEQFYGKSYDKLTEQGKDEMSHRIWEGIRRNEFKFSELPDKIKEKESARVFSDISKGDNRASNINSIPEQDKEDFIKAYRSGHKDEAYTVLDRPGFKEATGLRKSTQSPSNVQQENQESPTKGTHSTMSSEAERSSASLNKKIPASLDLASKGIEGLASVDSSENRKSPQTSGRGDAAASLQR